MPKPTPAQEAATTAARLVFYDADLREFGQQMKESWAEEAENFSETEAQWFDDAPIIFKAFKKLEGASKALQAWLVEEEGEEVPPEELQEWFENNEWDLAYVGSFDNFPIRVWNFAPWDGKLALALAEAGEDSIAVATALD